MRINDSENYDRIKDTISMKNLRTIMNNKHFCTSKVSTHAKISDATLSAYISGNKTPSLPTLISIADFLNCNLDYLIGRTNNPISINEINTISDDEDINLLIHNILSLPKDKQMLVIGFVHGILSK